MKNILESLQLFLWSYVFIYVSLCSLQITQVDIWWQLSEGMHLLHTFSLPIQPAAAYGLPASPYFDEYAGYEIVLVLIYKIAGFFGIWIFFIVIYLAIIFLPSLISRQSNLTFHFFSTLALLLAALLLRGRLEQRPEVVGSLLQVCLMLVLRKWNLETMTPKSLFPLFLIFLVWSNTHSTFVIGLITLSLWIGCEMILKFRNVPIKLLIKNAFLITATALLAVAFNPYGIQRLFFPFIQALDPGSTALSPEMWPIVSFRSAAAMCVLAAIILLAWGLLTSKKFSLWLILFSFFSVCMCFKSFRFVNLLAIALLFVCAAKDAEIKPKNFRPFPWIVFKAVALCFLCIFMLFGDAYTFIFTYNEVSSDRHFATHTSRFASDIVDPDVFVSNKRVAVLCGHGEGAYLSFQENKSFRPLLDSGLSHFSNDSKRYFFFLWHKPEAFDFAIKHLDISYVILNKETFHWTMCMLHRPDWKLIACTENGMLWQRIPGGIHALNPSDLQAIEKARGVLIENNDDIIGAFCYSTLLDRPLESLAILSKYDGPEWSESFFNYFCFWVDSLSPIMIQQFLATDHGNRNPLMYAILSSRLGSEKYTEFIKTVQPGPKPWFWKVVQVRDSLMRGDYEQARQIFDTISTTQPSSVTYYNLWREVRRKKISKSNDDILSPYGEWQTWDANARQFIELMSVRLNNRIAVLSGNHTR